MQTSELAGLFEDFYSKFVLRDLFGKITPGGILIFTVVSSHATIDGAISKAAALSFLAWVFLLGVAWLMGFAIQSAGELALGRCRPVNITRANNRFSGLAVVNLIGIHAAGIRGPLTLRHRLSPVVLLLLIVNARYPRIRSYVKPDSDRWQGEPFFFR